jgi:V/A-type H+-transporting ATPase subunit I
MIMSDTGYALILGGVLGLFWGRLGTSEFSRQMRQLWLVLFLASLVWGVLAGSYFGLQPPPKHWLAQLHIVDMQDTQYMLRFSIALGALHIAAANLIRARLLYRRSKAALAPLGWVVVILGGVLLWLASEDVLTEPVTQTIATWCLGVGFALILFFSKTEGKMPMRLGRGLIALTRITNVFGDVLSYIRLFALGLASASLALAFNDMAAQVRQATPAFGMLLAGLVILLGHGLNLALIIMGGFVHGLRLNFIEFFNWSLPEEGYAYRPFCKKESNAWIS